MMAEKDTVLGRSRTLLERYFEQQRTLADMAVSRAESASERLQVVQAALQSNERIMTEFLAVSQSLAFGTDSQAGICAAQIDPSLPAPIAAEEVTLKEALRAELAQATGFPASSINDHAAFVDLGLDSLSIAEIWGKLLDRFPEIVTFSEHMLSVRCIQDLERFSSAPSSATLATEIDAVAGQSIFDREAAIGTLLEQHPRYKQAGRELLNATDRQSLEKLLARFDSAPRRLTPIKERVERYVITWERVAPPAERPLPRRVRLVTPLNGSNASWLRQLLSRHTALTNAPDSPVVFLAESDTGVELTLERCTAAAFSLAKSLPASVPLTIVSYGEADPLNAGLAGLVQSLRREVSGCEVRYVCLTSPPAAMNEELLLRLLFGESTEPVFREAGSSAERRVADWSACPSIQGQPKLELNAGSRILVLGGGDGISAEMAVALAKEFRCEIVAVGRTGYPLSQPFPGIDHGPDAVQEIRRQIHKSGVPADQAATLSRQAARQRALWRTRHRVEEAGGRFSYIAGDLAQEAELQDAVSRALNGGPIHGLIHGAGIARDNRIERKSVDEFLQVVRAKAVGAVLLPSLLDRQPLQFAVFLSSMTAFTGTAGQTDYATANEILNAAARSWNSQVSFPVKSLMWSVWTETGFASPNLKKHMERLELGGISNSDGVAHFLREITAGGKQEDCLLLAPATTFRYSRNATPASVLLAAGAGAGQ